MDAGSHVTLNSRGSLADTAPRLARQMDAGSHVQLGLGNLDLWRR